MRAEMAYCLGVLDLFHGRWFMVKSTVAGRPPEDIFQLRLRWLILPSSPGPINLGPNVSARRYILAESWDGSYCLVTLVSGLSLPSQCPPESSQKPISSILMLSSTIVCSYIEALKMKHKTRGWRLNFSLKKRRRWPQFSGLCQFFPQTSRDQRGSRDWAHNKAPVLSTCKVEKIISWYWNARLSFCMINIEKEGVDIITSTFLLEHANKGPVSWIWQSLCWNNWRIILVPILIFILHKYYPNSCENWKQLGQFYPQPSVWPG